MKIASNKKIFLDTNVLLYQTFEDFDPEKRGEACNALDYLTENNYSIYISSQVLREFYAISTNKKIFEKPLSVEEAVSKIKEFRDYFTVLYENDASLSELIRLVLKYKIKKQDIHDANIVATMLTNGITEIFSFNEKDFKNYFEINLLESGTIDKTFIKK